VIETRAYSAQSPSRPEAGCASGRFLWVLGIILAVGGSYSQAGPILPRDNPTAFFTNAAIRLLLASGFTTGASSSTSNLLSVTTESGKTVTKLHIPISPLNL
jgi:hypothetical protein